MRTLQHFFVSGQCKRDLQQVLAFTFVRIKLSKQFFRVSVLEVVRRLLDLVLVIDVPVGHATERTVGPHQVVHTLDALQVHR